MKIKFLACILASAFFSCQSDKTENPDNKFCNHMEMHVTDPDDPINLIIDYDDSGRVTSLHGSGDENEQLDLVLQYNADGLIENDLGEEYEIQMDPSTKKITMFRFGDLTFGPAQLLTFENDQIAYSKVINEDKEGVETEEYTYDADGNAITVKANLIDENGDGMGTYFVEFTYDKTHNAVFANAPFLQAYTTFTAYLLPFGLTNKNLITHMTITFSYNDDVSVESRDVSYTFNDSGMVTSLVWSNTGGEFETTFGYECN